MGRGFAAHFLLELGKHFGGVVGTHAGDLVGELALAIEMGADAVDIGRTIHPHPTLSESVGLSAHAFESVCTDLPSLRKQ